MTPKDIAESDVMRLKVSYGVTGQERVKHTLASVLQCLLVTSPSDILKMFGTKNDMHLWNRFLFYPTKTCSSGRPKHHYGRTKRNSGRSTSEAAPFFRYT